MEAKIINLFSGPCAGKSTAAAHLFYELKKRHQNVELTNEYAKWLTYEENYKKIKNQLYLFAKQQNQIYRLLDKVDIIIMDSPLILSSIYKIEDSKALDDIILYEHNKLNNLNYYIKRETDYVNEGRYHSEDQAKEVDEKILAYLKDNKIEYKEISYKNAIEEILKDLNIEI